MTALSAADLYAFDVRGCAVLPGVLSAAQLETLNAEVRQSSAAGSSDRALLAHASSSSATSSG